MIITTDEELEKLKKIGRICAITLQEMKAATRVGMTTKELDEIGGKILARYGAISAPMAMYDFPGYTCISINEEIAHGIPGNRVIKDGDMVNIDVSAMLDGFYGDNGSSFLMGEGDIMGQKIIKVSKMALANAITAAKAGNKLNRIGKAVEDTAKRNGLPIIRNLCGHGVGHTLHDDPEMIDNYYDPADKRILQKGLVIAIEPFISEKESMVYTNKEDGWTLATRFGTRAAQQEHTIVITDKKPIILTLADL